jgi:hypothetical protein
MAPNITKVTNEHAVFTITLTTIFTKCHVLQNIIFNMLIVMPFWLTAV